MISKNQYLNNLIADCERAKTQRHSKHYEFFIEDCATFELSELSPLKSYNHAIYVITEINGNNHATRNELLNKKKDKTTGYKYPQINKNISDVLYVGSSTTGLINRLKQHMGQGYKGTYALHLSQWFIGICRIDAYIFDGVEMNRNVLQLIEDNMSYELKPMFGKQGSNNK